MAIDRLDKVTGSSSRRNEPSRFSSLALPINGQGFTVFNRLMVILMLTLAGVASATSVRTMNIDELVAGSELVVEGQVLQISVDQDANNPRIVTTTVLVEVIEVLKGEFDQPTISLSFLGGTYGDRRLKVEAMEYPDVNEHGIYFIESTGRQQVHPLLGWSQGHMVLLPDSGGQLRVHSRAGDPVALSKVTNQLMVQSEGPKPPIPQEPFRHGVKMTATLPASPEPAMLAVDFKAKIKQMAQ
ncbi:MAG: hypothetical protein VW985_13530 [Gammaproteobacteria bacterium]